MLPCRYSRRSPPNDWSDGYELEKKSKKKKSGSKRTTLRKTQGFFDEHEEEETNDLRNSSHADSMEKSTSSSLDTSGNLRKRKETMSKNKKEKKPSDIIEERDFKYVLTHPPWYGAYHSLQQQGSPMLSFSGIVALGRMIECSFCCLTLKRGSICEKEISRKVLTANCRLIFNVNTDEPNSDPHEVIHKATPEQRKLIEQQILQRYRAL